MQGWHFGGLGAGLLDWVVLGVLTDSPSLCREAFMRSGLRGGGSGGSDAAMVGPAARPFICIPPHTTEALPVPVTELS